MEYNWEYSIHSSVGFITSSSWPMQTLCHVFILYFRLSSIKMFFREIEEGKFLWQGGTVCSALKPSALEVAMLSCTCLNFIYAQEHSDILQGTVIHEH